MAWNRRRGGGYRRTGRRFFRRSRGRIRPTTEQGSARWTRCNVNIGYFQDVATAPLTVIGDQLSLVGSNSWEDTLSGQAQALMIARIFNNPMKGYDVLALRLSVEAMLGPGFAGYAATTPMEPQAYDINTLQVGFAVITNRVDEAGAPMAFPRYESSQWPVLNDAAELGDTEDRDYATRTHFRHDFTLAPHQVLGGSPTIPGTIFPAWPRARFTARVRVKRRIPDTHALFLALWNYTPPAWDESSVNVSWTLSGDLWYKMRL